MPTKMPNPLRKNLTEFSKNRLTIYTFLSRCYEVEIDQTFADKTAQEFSLDSDDANLCKQAQLITKSLTNLDENALEQLAVTFNRVFFGMGPKTAQKAFPYESVYTSDGGMMMQDAYVAVMSLYREEGFEKNPSFTEPDDHIAVELAFMQLLIKNTLEALESADEDKTAALLEKQHAFIENHLLNWMQPFITDMKASAEEGFYHHLATFTQEFLKQDQTALEEVLY